LNKFYVYKDGDSVTKTYVVTNGIVPQTEVSVLFTVPDGLVISQTSVSKGSFNKITKTWTVGEVVSNEIITAHVTFTVLNINYATFDVEAQISSNEGGLFCENHVYIEKSLTPCIGCDKAYPIFPAFSAENGSYTARTLNFVDNNVSFLTTGGTNPSIVGYYAPSEIHVGTDYRTLGNFELVNSNGISFGLNGSQVTASHNGLTTYVESNQVVSASNSSRTFQTLNFGNTDGASFYISSNSVFFSSAPLVISNNLYLTGNTSHTSMVLDYNNLTISGSGIITVGGSGSVLILNASTAAQTSLSYVNSNGITFGRSGSTLTASHNGLTSQSNQIISLSNTSFSFQTLSFANLNGVSFYGTNDSIAASIAGATAYSVMASGSTYTNSVSFKNGNGVSFTAGSDGIQGSIATQIVTNVSNSNNVSLGIAAGLLTASVNSQSNQTVGLYLLGNTSASSFSTFDARSLNISAKNGATVAITNNILHIEGPNNYITMFPGETDYNYLLSSVNSASQYLYPIKLTDNLIFNQIAIPINLRVSDISYTAAGQLSNYTNRTYSGALQYNLYSLSGSTLGLYKSGALSYGVNLSYTSAGYAGYGNVNYTLNTTRVYQGSSSLYSNSFTSFITNGIDATIDAKFSNISGSAFLGLVTLPSLDTISKGTYYMMVKNVYANTGLCITSLGFSGRATSQFSIINSSYINVSSNDVYQLYNSMPVSANVSLAVNASYHISQVSVTAATTGGYPALVFISKT